MEHVYETHADTWKWKKTHEGCKGEVLRNQNNLSYSENTAVPGQSHLFLRRSMSAAHVCVLGSLGPLTIQHF